MRALIIILAVLASNGAVAQEVSSRVKSAALLEVIATRGAECGLMRPWQVASLRALNLNDMERWPPERRDGVAAETARQLADADCENETVKLWIDASSRGFDSEMLPPYLIVYRMLASEENPPKIFSQTAVRIRYQPVIDAINAKLTEIEASGAVAEGGKPWPEYIEGIEGAVREFVALLDDDAAPLEKRNEAAGWIAQSAHIVELWLLEAED